mmetsp:Transcript_26307/g.39836  ORF Transcript_26307/g.39836 Transcript_26307/m.39836 type:complete len:1225 (+) Transcript_26307:161-3835(+)
MNRKRTRSEISNNELSDEKLVRKLEGTISEETQQSLTHHLGVVDMESSVMQPDWSNEIHSFNVNRKMQENHSDNDTVEVATPFSGSNGNNGVMFDVSTREANKVINIISIDVHTNLIQDDCPISVYGKKGTHLSFENSTESWTLLADTTTNCNGFGARTHVPPFRNPPSLNSGETYAFYAHMPTPSLRYVNGFKVGDIYESDGFFNIHEGTGVSGEFGNANTNFLQPRKWDGVVNYQVVSDLSFDGETCNDRLTTNYLDNLGSFGNMFDMKSRDHNLDVYGIDLYTDISEPVTYEIFTREGTYGNGMGPLEPSAIKNLGSNPTNIERMELLGWILVKNGTTTGRGFGVGTPIRGFTPFRVLPNSVQGFYITLSTPDIRYRNITVDLPDARTGDKYIENEDLSIHLGMSVGTWPADLAFFGPRLWSGSIIYTADHTCTTESPSLSPSSSPSTALPSSSPSATPTSGLKPLPNCTSISSLDTPFDGGTGSFGNMFTVTALERLSINYMDINVGTSDMVVVEVYTKKGGYNGYEEMPEAWTRVAAVTLHGADDGNPTSIEDKDFENIHMRADETRSFYVTLDNPVIKYSRTLSGVGAAFKTDDKLTINVGAGLAAQAFNGGVFEPRIFNGILHYEHKDKCAYETSTTVRYSFNIQHSADYTDMNELSDTVSDTVESTINGIMQMQKNLLEYAREHEMALAMVTTNLIDAGCTADPVDGACSSVETQATFSHLSSLEGGTIKYMLLQYKDDISKKLNDNDNFKSTYVGEFPVWSLIDIQLKGEFDRELSRSEQEYFEVITRAFLNDQLAERGIDVLGVTVEEQEIIGRRLQRTDDDEGPTRGTIDISTLIDGSYTPPPHIDFTGELEDALNADDGAAYQADLVNGRRDIPEDIIDIEDTFHLITEIDAKPQESLVPLSYTSSGSSTVPILVGSLCGLLLLFVIVIFCMFRRKKANRRAKLVNMEALDMKSAFFGSFFTKKSSSKNLFFDAECTYAEEDEDLKMSHGGVPMQMMEDDHAASAASMGYGGMPLHNSSRSAGSHGNASAARSPNASFSQLLASESRSPNASFSQLHGLESEPAFVDERVCQSMRQSRSTEEQQHRSVVSMSAMQQYGSGRSDFSGGSNRSPMRGPNDMVTMQLHGSGRSDFSGGSRSANSRSPGRGRSPIPVDQASALHGSANSNSYHTRGQSTFHDSSASNRYHQSAPVNFHSSANGFHDSGNSDSRWSH